MKPHSYPINLHHWQTQAMREIVELAANLSDGIYDSPADLAQTMKCLGDALSLALDPDEFAGQTEELLGAICALYVALNLAVIDRIEGAQNASFDQSEEVNQTIVEAIERLKVTTGDQKRDLITGTLSRIEMLAGARPSCLILETLEPALP